MRWLVLVEMFLAQLFAGLDARHDDDLLMAVEEGVDPDDAVV